MSRKENKIIWLSIDSEKIKQRIELITKKVEEVLYKFELQNEGQNSYNQSYHKK
jgi:hypothetical protein